MNEDAGPDRMRVPALAVFVAFLKLGLTSFGGPVAHLGYFRQAFVIRRGWLTADDFAELVALCQFLPGPASSQAGFAIGVRMAGLAGGMAAFVGFTLPSAILMLGAAFALDAIRPEWIAPLVHGLKLVAASVVAHAVVMMAVAHCRQVATAALAVAALVILLMASAPLAPPAVIAAALGAGAVAMRPEAVTPPQGSADRRAPHTAAALMIVFAGLLVGLPALRTLVDAPALATADTFYRAGALVFGGGHAVLPLLAGETASAVSEQDFLSGYGAAQALPGPLFAFAGYLGALGAPDAPHLGLGLLGLVMIFLPGLLLIAATDRAWRALRSHRRAAGAVACANAAVVGLLAAAWIEQIAGSATSGPAAAIITSAGLALLFIRRLPMLAVVIAIAVAGAVAHGTS